ncbi:MAG: DNA-processing protein DprA [Bacteroidetes bacterium]|nr:DNA-processing protein DprA [Bacteroidota bacterium]MDA0903883.1 DNA-processing protein DprA [Bacteroidota bacterium]MDA1243182.1 DNA-processing protein DprA [Bacteroidota bacterium]
MDWTAGDISCEVEQDMGRGSEPWAWMALLARPGSGVQAARRDVVMGGNAVNAWNRWESGNRVAAVDVGSRVDHQVEALQILGAWVVLWTDATYPWLLREIHDPPPVLFGLGRLAENRAWARGLSVVGTRACQPRGVDWASEVARDWQEAGGTVVSGLARGIDAAAHRAALDDTVAVLPCGLDAIHPAIHAPLAAEIVARGGLLLTEQPPGASVERWMFAARNRLVTGLTPATLVVQSPARGGSLISAQCALDQNREVYAMWDPAMGTSWSGNRFLVWSGAAQGVRNPTHLYHVMSGSQPAWQETPLRGVTEAPWLKDVWCALDGRKGMHPNRLAQQCGLDEGMLGQALFSLESRGLARRTWGGKWLRC